MDAFLVLTLISWGIGLAAAAGILLRKLPVRYEGGPSGALGFGAVALAFHIAGLLGLLGPADAAALSFGPLFAAIALAVAIDRARGGSVPMPPRRQIYPAGPMGYAGAVLAGIGLGITFGAALEGIVSFYVVTATALALILTGYALRAFAIQTSSPEAST